MYLKYNFLALAIGLLPMTSFGQIKLSKDSITIKNFNKKFDVIKNKGFFVMGSDSTSALFNINGQSAVSFIPKNWTIVPMLNKKILYSDGRHILQNNLNASAFYNSPYDLSILKLKKVGVQDEIDHLVYSPDGTFFLIVYKQGRLVKCSTLKKDKKNKILYGLNLTGSSSKLLINKKSNAAISAEGNKLTFLNLQAGSIRGSLQFSSTINDIAYSSNCQECAVLLKDGTLHTVSTLDLKEKKKYVLSKDIQRCCYMNQNKYIIVGTSKGLNVLNLLTGNIDYQLPTNKMNLKGIDDVYNSEKKEWLIYFSESNMFGMPLSVIERYHTMDLRRELDLRMAEWSKIRPGESETDYRARVNDKNRAKYALQLEHEIVTGMAGDLISKQKASFGNYIESNQALCINFDGMPSIYLNIPAQDLVELNTIEDIEFFNTIYGLTDEDKFEVIYTEARNKRTGKSYIYDNLGRKAISFDEDSFVPMEVIQLASIEAAKLEELMQEEMKKAINENFLSDHTKISVSTEVEQDIDADGNKILNYIINYQYDVEEEFSERDDFKAGKYNTVESNAAIQMIEIIKKSLNSNFKKYSTESKELKVTITGSADAIPIRGKLRYAGEYGNIEDLLVYQNEELATMTVTKSTGITCNEELAMVRAYSMADYLEKNILNEISIPIEKIFKIEVADEEGGKFRRIKVSLKFVDTFRK